jgi:hypothetical protein
MDYLDVPHSALTFNPNCADGSLLGLLCTTFDTMTVCPFFLLCVCKSPVFKLYPWQGDVSVCFRVWLFFSFGFDLF